ncbi:uncharacterized protein GIQ15_03850 [Arthroderma uncinatum]|uniref:uncharacterized protein n=1 Tax=Arthroderma uncinatum TaxID=74035 RepID=UPI00144AED4F|nr:uncharacterized protein GIQ15_03850 [Arthroderma uncinatum]KAF3481091.1 hypothetical protein GIQ15_03850 [Arthroderma uncinatum]
MAPVEKKVKKPIVKFPRKSTSNATLGTPGTAEKVKHKRTGTKSSKRPLPTENKQASPSVAAPKRRKKTQTPRASSSSALNGDVEPPPSESSASSEEPEYILAEITTVDGPTNRKVISKTAHPRVDYKLVTTLLHEVSFKKKKTRITKDGVKMFAKYIESFANEAISRSLEENRAGNTIDLMDTSATKRTETGHKKYLEVEQPPLLRTLPAPMCQLRLFLRP